MGSLVIATPVIFFKIKEHTDVEDDLRFSDETALEVMGANAAVAKVQTPSQTDDESRSTPEKTQA